MAKCLCSCSLARHCSPARQVSGCLTGGGRAGLWRERLACRRGASRYPCSACPFVWQSLHPTLPPSPCAVGVVPWCKGGSSSVFSSYKAWSWCWPGTLEFTWSPLNYQMHRGTATSKYSLNMICGSSVISFVGLSTTTHTGTGGCYWVMIYYWEGDLSSQVLEFLKPVCLHWFIRNLASQLLW